MKVTDDSIHGRRVLSGDGLELGEVSKLFVHDGWQVRSFEVRLRKDAAERLGVQHARFHNATIEISTELVQSVGDVVLLTAPADALHAPPAPVPVPH
jgi:sporulation protein YlmC with PRC-barrel domain